MFLYTVYVARLGKTRGGWGVVVRFEKCSSDLSVFKGMGERMEPSMDLGGGGCAASLCQTGHMVWFVR